LTVGLRDGNYRLAIAGAGGGHLWSTLAAPSVEKFFLPLGRSGKRILSRAFVGLLAAMMFSAAEGATQINSSRVARMSQKADAAVAAFHRAVPQVRTLPQDGIECCLILTIELISAALLVPILSENVNVPESDQKADSLSARLWNFFCISSSYPLDAKTSTGRARIFHAPLQQLKNAPERSVKLEKSLQP
jgi:hypothetical protein